MRNFGAGVRVGSREMMEKIAKWREDIYILEEDFRRIEGKDFPVWRE